VSKDFVLTSVTISGSHTQLVRDVREFPESDRELSRSWWSTLKFSATLRT